MICGLKTIPVLAPLCGQPAGHAGPCTGTTLEWQVKRLQDDKRSYMDAWQDDEKLISELRAQLKSATLSAELRRTLIGQARLACYVDVDNQTDAERSAADRVEAAIAKVLG
jgi:hypothetical protein